MHRGIGIAMPLFAVLILAMSAGPGAAQLIFVQGDGEPIRPFVRPDATDRLMAKKNRIKATLRFGYLSDDKSAEALRRRTEFNFQGYPTTIYDFSPQGRIEAKKEYTYDLGGINILSAVIEQYAVNGDLTLALTYKFDASGKIQDYQEVNGQGHGRRMSYLYNAQGKLLRLQYIEPDGLPGGAEVYTYGANGLEAHMEKTDIAGDLVERVTWVLDPKGRITAENRYAGGSSPILLFSYKFQYDDKSRLVRKEKYSRDLVLSGYETWTYDSHGRLLEHKVLETGETKPSRETYKYDPAGRVAQNINYNGDGSIFQWYKYRYDSLSTGAGFERLLPDGKVDFRKLEVFNKARQCISREESYPDGTGEHRTTYRYTDDGLGIEEKHFSGSNEDAVFWFVHEQY